MHSAMMCRIVDAALAVPHITADAEVGAVSLCVVEMGSLVVRWAAASVSQSMR